MIVFSKLIQKFFKKIKILFFSLITLIIVSSASSKNNEKTVLIYAPISLSEVINEVIDYYKKTNNEIEVKLIFMGTSQLVMQIKNGASPDIFISANDEWMNYLETKKIILKKYRKDFLYNSLVVITNKKNSIKKIKNINQLEKAFLKSKTKISLAMTDSIPAGIYAKSYLKNISLWKKLKKNYVESTNVRAALNYVVRNDLEFGIVYKTEAINNSRVKIVYFIEGTKHKKIIYPIAVLNNKMETMEIYHFLLDKKNLSKTLKRGFEIPK